MKKILFIVIVFIFGFSSSSVYASPYVLNLTRTLSNGSNGYDVSSLQKLLQSEGFLSSEITGFYGSQTELAIQQFQIQEGIVSSGKKSKNGFGVVDAKTQSALYMRSIDSISEGDAPGVALKLNIINATDGGGSETGNGPLNTIDGDFKTKWTHNMPVSLILDLGTVKTINETKILFNEWSQGRFYKYSIDTSVDNLFWSPAVVEKTSVAFRTVDLFSERQARYIKIIGLSAIPETIQLGIWEIQVWGPDIESNYSRVVSSSDTNNNEVVSIIPVNDSIENTLVENKIDNSIQSIASKNLLSNALSAFWSALGESLLLIFGY